MYLPTKNYRSASSFYVIGEIFPLLKALTVNSALNRPLTWTRHVTVKLD